MKLYLWRKLLGSSCPEDENKEKTPGNTGLCAVVAWREVWVRGAGMGAEDETPDLGSMAKTLLALEEIPAQTRRQHLSQGTSVLGSLPIVASP